MKVIDFPSSERLRANSDFELKLVTIWSLGIGSVPIRKPSVVMLSRKIGEVTPKLPSAPSLLKTAGYVPSATAVLQPELLAFGMVTVVVPPAISGIVIVPGTQTGGRVCPRVTVEASPRYTLRLSTRVSGWNWKRREWSSAAALSTNVPAARMETAAMPRVVGMIAFFTY